MKRIILVFLLAILPLQLSWGAITAFSQDETSETVQGDWQPEVKGADSDQPVSKKDSSKICSASCTCHLAAAVLCFPVLPSLMKMQETPTQLEVSFYRSPIPDGPLRPNWRTPG